MRFALRSLLAAATLATLVTVPAGAHAQRLMAYQIVNSYMTTQEAFGSYNSNSAEPPPMVEAFPVGVDNVGYYFHYRGMKPDKDTFRIGFTYQGGEVRHGSLHTFDDEAGEETLTIPADSMQLPGPYKATLYIDDKPAQSVSFKVIFTPKITNAYMITEKAWNAFGPDSKNDPSKAPSFAAGVSRVGVFYAYTGMVKTDIHYVGVYNNANGSLVHRSDNAKSSYVPSGSVAIILPDDAGSYPRGTYRTDLYVNYAMVKSMTWTVK